MNPEVVYVFLIGASAIGSAVLLVVVGLLLTQLRQRNRGAACKNHNTATLPPASNVPT